MEMNESESRPASRTRRLWKNLMIVFESRVAIIGLGIVAFWVLVAFVSLFWIPFDPNASSFKPNLAPNQTNWLGTDRWEGTSCRGS